MRLIQLVDPADEPTIQDGSRGKEVGLLQPVRIHWALGVRPSELGLWRH